MVRPGPSSPGRLAPPPQGLGRGGGAADNGCGARRSRGGGRAGRHRTAEGGGRGERSGGRARVGGRGRPSASPSPRQSTAASTQSASRQASPQPLPLRPFLTWRAELPAAPLPYGSSSAISRLAEGRDAGPTGKKESTTIESGGTTAASGRVTSARRGVVPAPPTARAPSWLWVAGRKQDGGRGVGGQPGRLRPGGSMGGPCPSVVPPSPVRGPGSVVR